ncbi:MAG: CocE/NonD family hydrolase [Rhizobiaceae bacterium]
MKTVTDFPRKIFEQLDVGIVMSDGCRLSARIWMPVDALENPVPVILEHLPYRKRDGTIYRDSLTHPYLAGHGYACIRIDMRGNGDSEGLMADEYIQQELDDACEVLKWAAAQDWSSGTAGMMGISWGGFNCLQVAALQPPSLKAVISICSTVDRYADDIHYKGGCLLNENFGWSANMLSYSSRPPDPELVGDKWKEMWLNRLENMPLLISTWLRHPHRDDYWKHGSICEDYSKVKAAVLSLGGWHDGYRNTISHLVSNIQAPVKGIVGPWIHKYPHYAAPEPRIGFLQEALRWWDKWLKGKDTGVENDPAYRAWLMDSIDPKPWLPKRPGRWIVEDVWPSPAIKPLILHMNASALGDRPDTVSVEISSAQDAGLTAGEFFPFTFGPELPDEQSEDDLRSVVFDADILAEPIDIVGAPEFSFTFTCDQPQGLIAVRLCEVFPDGRSALITYGYLNLTHFESHENPQGLEPGRVYRTTFLLDQISARVAAGHRLRLGLASSSWPTLWPSPRRAKVTITQGTLSVPIRPTPKQDRDEWTFEGPEGATPWRTETVRATKSTRESERLADGTLELVVSNDFGADKDLEHGLISGSSTLEKWSIHPDDPLSANAEISWTQTLERGDWSIRTETHSAMRSDLTHFHITASLKAYEGDALVFEREWVDRIERGLL